MRRIIIIVFWMKGLAQFKHFNVCLKVYFDVWEDELDEVVTLLYKTNSK